MPAEKRGGDLLDRWCLDAIKKSQALKSPHLHCLFDNDCGDWLVSSKGWEFPVSLRKCLFFSPRVFPVLFRSPSTMNRIPHLVLPKALSARKWHQPDTRPCLRYPGSEGPFLSWVTTRKLWKEQTAMWLCLGSMDFCKSGGHTKDIVALKYRSWSLLLWAGPYEHRLVYSSWTQICDYLSI